MIRDAENVGGFSEKANPAANAASAMTKPSVVDPRSGVKVIRVESEGNIVEPVPVRRTSCGERR